MATMLGHPDNHRSGRPDLRRALAVIMSDKQKYRLVETHTLDTWCFMAFFAIMTMISFWG
jgi:hypothetical protein